MKILHEDISIIVQGPVDWTINRRFARPTTLALTRNLRRLLPEARIILSTWEGQNVEGLDFDTVIYSPDPGPQAAWPSFIPTNVNRQIVSTVAGLRAAKTRLCLKIRTDMVLTGIDFIDMFSKLSPIPGERTLFNYPILANNFTSRKTSEVLKRLPDNPVPYHPCDHLHFGMRYDLLRFWDVPLQTEADAFYFMDRTQPNRWRGHEFSRLAPEQHLFTEALKKKFDIDLEHYGDDRTHVIESSDHFMSTQFFFVPDRYVPVHFEKYHTDHHYSFEWMRWDDLGHPREEDGFLTRRLKKLRQRFELP